MKLVTIGTRGTDVILAGLKLGRSFNLADLREAYGAIRNERGEGLPKEWKQGVSNELHRRSSDFSRFRKEGHELDLIARVGSGRYCFRDEVRPKLIDAANERSDLLIVKNTLVVPIAGEDVVDRAVSHAIGIYAQQQVVMALQSRGYKIIMDTSASHAYDVMFRDRARWSTPQIIECKGTRRADGSFGLTPNELTVLCGNSANFWLGVVYNIEIVDGKATGGDVFITEPPILSKWRFTSGFRLERIRPMPGASAEARLL